MKVLKIVGISVLAVAAAAVVFIMLMAHGDEMVNSVVMADSKITDINVLDCIASSKGKDANGFAGALYTTSCVEYAKYVTTELAPVPADKDLFANILFIAVPKGIRFQGVWTHAGSTVEDETVELTADSSRQTAYFKLDGSLVTRGDYSFTVSYDGKQLYSQTFQVR